MGLGSGDRLARGAKSATFGGVSNKTQIAWDHMWMDGRKFKRTYGISKKQYAAKGNK